MSYLWILFLLGSVFIAYFASVLLAGNSKMSYDNSWKNDRASVYSAVSPLALTKLSTSLNGVEEVSEISASTLWQKTGAVMMIIRRPGWALCRAEAKELSQTVKPVLDKYNIPLVGVVKETLGVKEFHDFFAGEIYLDKRRNFYKALGYNKGSLFSLLHPTAIKNWITKGNVTGNMDGEGFVMGGLIVFHPGDIGIEFLFKEINFGDHASMENVLEAVKRILNTSKL